jgi:hypothetical protein
LSTGRGHDAAGAVLLFATNVASILTLGVVVMFIKKVHRMGDASRRTLAVKRAAAVLLFLLLVFIAVPLGFTSQRLKDVAAIEKCVTNAANDWAKPYGWKATIVIATGAPNEYNAEIFLTGPPPFPEEDFPEAPTKCDVTDVIVKYVPSLSVEW